MSQPRPGALPLVQTSPQSPPIVELVRFLGRVLAVSYGLLSRTTVTFALSLIAPLSLLYSPVGYLLAPVFVLAHVLLDVFVLTPYALAQAVARNIYPVYVFIGAACICAVCVGFAARMLSSGLRTLLLGPRRAPPPKKQELEAQADTKGKSAMKPATTTAAPKTRMRKRVSIKEEKDT